MTSHIGAQHAPLAAQREGRRREADEEHEDGGHGRRDARLRRPLVVLVRKHLGCIGVTGTLGLGLGLGVRVSKIGKILQIVGLVLGCIKTKFCKKICV